MKNINEPFIEAKAQPIAKKSFLKKLKFSEALLILTLLILTILGSYPFISASRAAHMFTGSAAPKVLTGPEAVQKSINLDDV